MKSQATGGTAKSGYKKLRPEGPKKTLRKERVQITSAIKKAGTYRGNAGRPAKKGK